MSPVNLDSWDMEVLKKLENKELYFISKIRIIDLKTHL
jgi:hypothetical protein